MMAPSKQFPMDTIVISRRTNMRNAWTRLVQTAVAGLLVVGFGCAGDVDEVDRVQPAYITKADLLDSSWYYRRTVVDSAETMGPTTTIGTGDLFTIERIRWDIQEELLIAYRDYEYIIGGEDGQLPGSDYYGTPMAAFPITSHFDIIYQYNPETGEKTNVRVEDQSDRQWFERDYMRVDWSTNKNPALDFLIPVETSAQDFYVHEDDVTNPYRARIEPADGFMDFVVTHQITPDWYTCGYELDLGYTWCGPGEVRVRHAFMKVDQEAEDGYQPLYYPDSVIKHDAQGNEIFDPETLEVMREPVFERFGYYRLERLTYDRERELTESGRLYRILRFDIWERSVNEMGQEVAYSARTVKPIIYYLNWDFPADLLDVGYRVGEGWNDVFRDTVASLQGKPKSQVPDVFIVKQNSCNLTNLSRYLGAHDDVSDSVNAAMGGTRTTRAKIDPAKLDNWCAATEYFSKDLDDRFTWEQEGDPRYNMLNWISEITPSGFAGYGPMLADPMSGRIVTATANVMGWTIENAATRALEYVDYINDELSLEDLMLGSNLPRLYTTEEFDTHHTSSLESAHLRAKHSVSPEHLESLKSRFSELEAGDSGPMVELENRDHFADRLSRVIGTPLEQQYSITPEDLMIASGAQWQPGMPVSDELMQNASRFQRILDGVKQMDKRDKYLQERTMCPLAELDDALVGLAKELKCLGSCADECFDGGAAPASCVELSADDRRHARRQAIRAYYFEAVALHEVGHNVGLRHNFEGSYDALNYNREYWELETSGLSDQEKLDARQTEYQYSSIMDYHGKINGDFRGLGRYDAAAVKFGYGQMVETFTTANAGVGNRKEALNWRFYNDYTKIPQYVGSVQQMYARADVKWDWNVETTPPANEVPYMFCSDEFAPYTPTCRRFDFGANQREIVAAQYSKYKDYFIFTNFLRNRLNLDPNRVLNRGPSTFSEILMTYQYMYLYQSLDRGFLDTDLGTDMAAAVADGFNLMGEVLSMPVPGLYRRCVDQGDGSVMYYENDDVVVNDAGEYLGYDDELCDMDEASALIMPLGDAEPLFLELTWDMDWEQRTYTYFGTFWDKAAALAYLSLPSAYFFRTDSYADWRAFSVSPYRIYKEPILEVMRSLMTWDRRALASRYDEVSHTFKPRRLIDPAQPLLQVSSDGLTYADNGINDTSLPMIKPPIVRNLRDDATIYGSAFLTSPLDDMLDFSKHTRVTVKGGFDDIEPANLNPGDTAECAIPDSGITYRAFRVNDGFEIAWDLVSDCAQQSGELKQAQEDYAQAQVDLAGDPDDVALIEAYNEAFDAMDDAEDVLASVQQNLQYMRLVHLVYEFGAEL